MVLDLQQRAAVMSPHKNTLVLACPGSGKTRVLVERVAHLITKQKVSPFEIVCLTFTRRAAHEMRVRLEQRIGKTLAYRLKIGTIHALGLRFIRMFGEELGLRPSHLTIYGPWEEDFLMRETAKLVKAKPKFKEMMEEFYRTGMEPEPGHPHRRFFEVFMARLRANNSITYGLILTSMKRLMPSITKRTVSHVLVDEAQDIDWLQWSIIEAFQAHNPLCNLFIVGDQDQSIYEWRGAEPDSLTGMAQIYNLFRLENNYRSAREIVEPAARLIGYNKRRLPKTMRSATEAVGKTAVVCNQDSKEVAAMIAEIGERPKGETIGVLSRTHKLLETLSRELTAIGVDHHYCGRTSKIMDTEDFRRIHALFKLRHNPYDNFSFALVRPFFGIGDAEYLSILEGSLTNETSHFQEWGKTTHKPEFVCMVSREPWSFPELIRIVEKIVAEHAVDLDSGVCLQIARTCAERGMGLEDYLEWVATFDVQDDVREAHQAKVQLMTIHAAKGLEFELVLVLGVNEGILPSKQAGDPNVEEERRLAYVAMTRAETELILTVRPESKTYQYESGKERTFNTPVSRFISEAAA